MPSMARLAIILTLIYALFWALGPLLTDMGIWGAHADYYGLPLWFWLSCILTPLFFIMGLFYLFGRGGHKE
ncbi:DUF997 family protein [Shewanella carassii]|uniref:DUF997 family protein n=1 Tax=Shewanella carassii TaxID=1987584 RepID=A0ABQ1SW71_9GAMM|nr:DUF997 family protein [Shewanella carassii]GGE67510.1 hypothetical protein GCM10011520_05230 [Shewanella carassii]